jgi:hypothetical protein
VWIGDESWLSSGEGMKGDEGAIAARRQRAGSRQERGRSEKARLVG